MKVPDKKGPDGMWQQATRKDGKSCFTISGRLWTNMSSRCEVGGNFQRTRPTYIGCSMSPLFQDFQAFTEWHIGQVGYGVDGYHLDKDILVAGNKIYSETTCALVPKQLNTFFNACNSARGEYKQGVSWRKDTGDFRAQINIGGKYKWLGRHQTEDGAFAVYKLAKDAEARRWLSRLLVGEFVVDSRIISRVAEWVL